MLYVVLSCVPPTPSPLACVFLLFLLFLFLFFSAAFARRASFKDPVKKNPWLLSSDSSL